MEAAFGEEPREPSGVKGMFYSNLGLGGGYANMGGKVHQAEFVHFGVCVCVCSSPQLKRETGWLTD